MVNNKVYSENNRYFAIKNMTKGKLPRLPFESMKKQIMGSKYDLSLVFIGDRRSHTLNKKYRKKDAPANVLSFPLEKNAGEVFINTSKAKKDSKDFNMSYKSFVGMLFIHALLHLKGLSHGSKMKGIEDKWKKAYNIIEL